MCTNSWHLHDILGSIYLWQLLATSPNQLGFIPPTILQLATQGMFTTNCHKRLKGDQVVAYKILDPLYDGTKSLRCIVAPCWIEDYSHSAAKRNKENPLVVVIKYSTGNSDKEIETEIAGLQALKAFNAHIDVHQRQPLYVTLAIFESSN